MSYLSLTDKQAFYVRGLTSKSTALEPFPVSGGWMLPIETQTDPAHGSTVTSFLGAITPTGGNAVILAQILPYVGYTAPLRNTNKAGLDSSVSLIIVDGDSRAFGYPLAATQKFATVLEQKLSPGARIVQTASNGQTMQAIASQVNTRITPIFDSQAPKNILLVGGIGINDIINANQTDLNLRTSYTNYCSAAVSAGFKLILATVCKQYPMADPKLTYVNNFNAWLRTNYAATLGASVLVELDAEPSLAFSANIWADDLHFTAVGQVIWASLFQTAVNTILGVQTGQVNLKS